MAQRTARKKKWSDLSPTQRRLVVVTGVAELLLSSAALRDLGRRSPERVRGPKPLWRVALLVQPVGPLAYFALGRR
ncbi:MAG: PLDc N-terminal domain-containing protein [Nocardioidaceae bacterium]